MSGEKIPPFTVAEKATDEFIAMSSNKIVRTGKDMAGHFVAGVDDGVVIYEVDEIEGPHQSEAGSIGQNEPRPYQAGRPARDHHEIDQAAQGRRGGPEVSHVNQDTFGQVESDPR